MEERNYKLIAKAHQALMLSAKKAKRDGLPREQWKWSKTISDFVQEHNLDKNIAEHISIFVWTFKR